MIQWTTESNTLNITFFCYHKTSEVKEHVCSLFQHFSDMRHFFRTKGILQITFKLLFERLVNAKLSI